jgi:OOP family OmpA-OmpF porin
MVGSPARARVRIGVLAAGVVVGGAAAAEPRPDGDAPSRLEASGFVGVDHFGDHIQLGNSFAPEQIPGTSLLLGGRLGYLAVPELVPGAGLRPQLAVEAEVKLALGSTGGGFDGGRPSYFAPVLGWRGHVALRLAGVPVVRPFLVVGVGGETVMSSSPYMAKETDAAVYWGPGVTYPLGGRWQARLDLRHGITPARDRGLTSTIELQLGLATTFELATRRRAPGAPAPELAAEEPTAPGPAAPPACPTEDEVIRGERAAATPGCPDLDPDHDGVIGSRDRCPEEPEDLDHFADDDGCPDPDNDLDGVPDAQDACPNDPETRNGIDDGDGCPDTIPADVTARLDAAGRIRFAAGKARLAAEDRAALPSLLGVLRDHPALRLRVLVHATGPGAKAEDLARRRADAIKWALVDQGVVAERIESAAAEPRDGALVEATIVLPAP